jgi:pimeloyl-ACP methyl ester carboxylesterase
VSTDYVSRFVTAQDGLKLHMRVYGPRVTENLPVVCLPGLARTSADFHPLAGALSARPPRQVFAMDYRGRGRSDYDRDPANYNLAIELNDLLAVLTALGIGPAVFVGTSRGGILTMLLAVARPGAIAGVVLNDIGPVIEPHGLMRIKGYVGKLPQPVSFEDGGEMLRRLFGAHFPKLSSADWTAYAQRTFEERDGKLVPSYDPQLAQTLAGVDGERRTPPLWKEFNALARVPVMVVRGANSDLLAPETVAAMRLARPDLHVLEVPDQGHAPLLSDDATIRRIADFAGACEGNGKVRAASP